MWWMRPRFVLRLSAWQDGTLMRQASGTWTDLDLKIDFANPMESAPSCISGCF